jgi:hypothetical protein
VDQGAQIVSFFQNEFLILYRKNQSHFRIFVSTFGNKVLQPAYVYVEINRKRKAAVELGVKLSREDFAGHRSVALAVQSWAKDKTGIDLPKRFFVEFGRAESGGKDMYGVDQPRKGMYGVDLVEQFRWALKADEVRYISKQAKRFKTIYKLQ